VVGELRHAAAIILVYNFWASAAPSLSTPYPNALHAEGRALRGAELGRL
jgi:hypothetical protein